jgi:hypothetical protein
MYAMKLLNKILIFAAAGLFSYTAAASLLETTNNPTHNSDTLKTAPINRNNIYLNQYVTSYFSELGNTEIAVKLSNREQTAWSYNEFNQPHERDNIENHTNIVAAPHTNDYRLNQDSALSASQKVEVHNDDDIPLPTVPLPATAWLFLGGLLGFLRFQRKSN